MPLLCSTSILPEANMQPKRSLFSSQQFCLWGRGVPVPGHMTGDVGIDTVLDGLKAYKG